MLTYILCAAALLFIAVTLLVRANDLDWGRGSLPDGMTRKLVTIRAIGLVVAGFSPWAIIAHDYFLQRDPPSPFECLFYAGLAFVFFTTPHMPPWWKQISEDTLPKTDRRADRRSAIDRTRDERP